MAESLRAKSRRDWANDDNSNESIRLGCMLRIADATERMAQRYTELIDERDRLIRSCQYRDERITQLERQLSAARGQITKLRKRLAAQEQGGSDANNHT